MTNEIIVIIPEELSPVVASSGLEKAQIYAATYAPFILKVKEIAEKITGLNPDNPLDLKIARDCRLALVKNRTATGKQKDADKANVLAEGNLIQALHNVVVNKSYLIEADFEAIEKLAENKERERKAELKADRENQLAEFDLDLTGYNLAEMSDQTFSDLLTSRRLLREELIATAAKVEAERIEFERVQAEEREAQRLENIRLHAENEAKEKQLQAEREAAKKESDRIAKDNADKVAAIEASNKAARDKAAKEQAAKDKAAADELAKLAKELQAKKDAEAKAAKEQDDKAAADKAAADKAAKAPVKDQLNVWVGNFELPAGPDNETAIEIRAKFNGWKQWALTQIETL